MSDVQVPDKIADIEAFRITWRKPSETVDDSPEAGRYKSLLRRPTRVSGKEG
jgi:hypothetical protein